jgi:hypothetical protein
MDVGSASREALTSFCLESILASETALLDRYSTVTGIFHLGGRAELLLVEPGFVIDLSLAGHSVTSPEETIAELKNLFDL